MSDTPISLRLYRRLLNLYPASFREDYAALLEREFRDELADARKSAGGLARLWMVLLRDLALSVPGQLLREISQDARHTFRIWGKHPWQTGFAIGALAIGIGVNTGVFSVVNALLLRSLPFREPNRLAALTTSFMPPDDSSAQFHDWARHIFYASDAAVFEKGDFNLGDAQRLQRAHIAQTSANFFSLLGAQPLIGRTFSPGEDTNGRNGIAVISYGLWQSLFAGDGRVLGSTIRLNGMPLTIIGVMPSNFDFPSRTALWKAAQFTRGNNGWWTIVRLKPEITWREAGAALTAEADRRWPNRPRIDKIRYPVKIVRLQDELAGPVKKASLLFMAGVTLVLLIACTNVANLLLARTADRGSELSIRSALGASRARLIQQLLTECLLLSSIAACAGLLVAFWTASISAKVEPAPLITQSYKIFDGRVLAFMAGLSIVSALVFGILPAMNAGRVHVFASRDGGTRGSRFTRETLVAAQVMITIVLLTASISVGRAFLHLRGTDRGFNVKGLVTVSASLEGTLNKTTGRQLSYFEEVLARIRRIPGVQSASATEFLPLYSADFLGAPLGLDGHSPGQNSEILPIFADYFQTMGGHILYGREFNDAEIRTQARLAVVNETFAELFGGSKDILGRQVTMQGQPPLKIIGVVKGEDFMSQYITGIADINPAQVFVPSESPGGFFSTFVARVNGQAQDRVAMIRDVIRSVDPQVPVFGAMTMEQRLQDALARPKFFRTAGFFFAGFAVLLAVIGIYGIVAYAVSQRTREMGVRLALGSTPTRLRGTLLRQGFPPVVIGAASGIAAALLIGRFLESLVEGAKSMDILTLAFSVVFLTLITSMATWTATRKIASLDVMEILRA